MAVIETWYKQDLQKAVQVKHFEGSLFSGNANGNRIGIIVTNNGTAASLSGTVSGYVVHSDGTSVPCTGSLSGNRASVLLPAAAYKPGIVFISIFLTSGSTVTTLAAVTAMVRQARTDSQVSPGSVVTDWTQTINAAMQSVVTANAANMAVEYGSLSYPVPVGKYTIYNDLLYRCTTPIATAESWTASHWTRVRIADEVSDLKSAFDDIAIVSRNIFDVNNALDGFYNNSKELTSSDTLKHVNIPVSVGDTVRFSVDSLVSVYNIGNILDGNLSPLFIIRNGSSYATYTKYDTYYEVTILRADAQYLAITFSLNNVNAFMITKNNAFPSAYEPYGNKLDVNALPDNSITPGKTTFSNVLNNVPILEDETNDIKAGISKYLYYLRPYDRQLFDVSTMCPDPALPLSVASSKNISTNAASRMYFVEVNGEPGEVYSVNVLGSNPKRKREYIYASNTLPVNGGTVLQIGISSVSDNRAKITLEQNSRYIIVEVTLEYPGATESEYTAAANQVMQDAVIRKGDYDTTYYSYEEYPYYMIDVSDEKIAEKISEIGVLKYQGTPNYQKYLAVGADGFVTLVESSGGAISDPAVRYHHASVIKLGQNVITSASASLGTGWSGSYANGYSHADGNTGKLIFTVPTEVGRKYVLDFDTVSMLGTLKCYVSIGDGPLIDPYNGTTHCTIGFIADGGYLQFTPDANLVDTISNITLKPFDENGTESVIVCDNINHGNAANNVTGFWNVAIGAENTLQSNVAGSRNIAIGFSSLFKMEYGTRNIAIGTYSMPYVQEGERNIAIGADTIYGSNDSTYKKAYDNVAIGKAALRHGTDVQKNIAIGTNAMSNGDQQAKRNVAIGMGAGNYSHNDNTFVGNDSGYYTKGSQNVAVGSGAGNDLYNTGDGNTCIGYHAGTKADDSSSSNIKTINNAIAIGANVKAKATNEARFGNADNVIILAGKKIVFNNDNTVTWENI